MDKQRTAALIAVSVMFLAVGTAVMILGGPATAQTSSGDQAANGDVQAAADTGNGGSVWGANYFPNVPLITHRGEHVRFFDLIKDKVVAINFIYTTCPDSCPMETARLLQVQQLLGDRMGRDVFFYSITIDPETDTQPVLAKFVKDWNIGPGWTFLTGTKENIITLRRKLGVYIEDIQGPGSRDHNLSLVIGNQASGRWMKRSPFENAYVLATNIGGELHNWKMPPVKKQDYTQAPELRRISKGESLFRTRCEACHTIGEGDVNDLRARKIGPDLYMVTKRRDHDWLVRWMAAPDTMLQQKDPIAMDLLARYNNVPMPNLQLNQVEIDALLEHFEETSAEVAKHVAMGHHPDPLAGQDPEQQAAARQPDPAAHDHAGVHDHAGMKEP